jgi:hypothetical protein
MKVARRAPHRVQEGREEGREEERKGWRQEEGRDQVSDYKKRNVAREAQHRMQEV